MRSYVVMMMTAKKIASSNTAASRTTTDVPSLASWATLCSTSRSISGHTILFSCCLAASLLNTLAASALRLMWPSSPTISKAKISTNALWHAVPGRYASWPSLSQSTTAAPNPASRRATLDLPLAEPPVRPMTQGWTGMAGLSVGSCRMVPRSRILPEEELALVSSSVDCRSSSSTSVTTWPSSSGRPFSSLTRLIAATPPFVSSLTTSMSMLGSHAVGPRGSSMGTAYSSTLGSSSSTSWAKPSILSLRGLISSVRVFFLSKGPSAIPQRSRPLHRSSAADNITRWPTCGWSKVPPNTTLA
ncbi:hypothetical protein E2C01_022700 [Portunus trituberculatus]|uniref:Uncharacterized protein n=1 Tax=Portunus trituberculatus TaxID=210409 RepID=A0A5B7E8B5_PORTR|nr:hypothetical protein [Portunus trituberculatus]